MVFHVLTLFPEMIVAGCNSSILKRAMDKELIRLNAVNIRDFTTDKHGKVDDYTYGGGAGMLMQAQPVYDAWCSLRKSRGDKSLRCVYVTPQGHPFTQKMAEDFSQEEELVFLCGHYEGIDERVLEEIVTDRVSIGDFVLTGGELPAMVMIDAISRLVPGVLSNDESAETESFANDLLEYPQYSRPKQWHGKSVPEVLLSGDHRRIAKWRTQEAEERTRQYRPDLYERYERRQNLSKLLSKHKKENAYMIDSLSRGAAEPLASRKDQVIARNRCKGLVQMCCDTAESGLELLKHLPEDCSGLLHNCRELNDTLIHDYGFALQTAYRQVVYTQKTALPVGNRDIRSFPMEELTFALEHSGGADEDFLRDRIRCGELFAAYVDDNITGFACRRADGSLVSLYVKPEYRGQKIGSSLAAWLVNHALECGSLPYFHVPEDRAETIAMLEKLGLYTGARKVYMLYR